MDGQAARWDTAVMQSSTRMKKRPTSLSATDQAVREEKRPTQGRGHDAGCVSWWVGKGWAFNSAAELRTNDPADGVADAHWLSGFFFGAVVCCDTGRVRCNKRPRTQQIVLRHLTTAQFSDRAGVRGLPRPFSPRQTPNGLPFANGLVCDSASFGNHAERVLLDHGLKGVSLVHP